MKRFTKIALILATIFVVIGIACIIGSVSMGLTWGNFTGMVRDGKFSFGPIHVGDMIEGGIIVGSELPAEGEITKIEEHCSNLEIEIGAGTLELRYGDVEHIQIQQEKIGKFSCYIEEDTLHIEGKQSWGVKNSGGSIVITIPKGMTFQEVDLEVGAGEADVDGLIVHTANIEVGAGEANVTNLDATELKAETGAGKLYAELLGKEEDYDYNLECGIGEIKIENDSYGGLGRKQNITNPGAERFLDIECGVGEVHIEFQSENL